MSKKWICSYWVTLFSIVNYHLRIALLVILIGHWIVIGIITVQKHLWTDRAAFVLLQIIKTMGDPLAYRCDA